jgi:hypothetical protein
MKVCSCTFFLTRIECVEGKLKKKSTERERKRENVEPKTNMASQQLRQKKDNHNFKSIPIKRELREQKCISIIMNKN